MITVKINEIEKKEDKQTYPVVRRYKRYPELIVMFLSKTECLVLQNSKNIYIAYDTSIVSKGWCNNDVDYETVKSLTIESE